MRAALSPLREIADEVIIAAGGPVSEEDLCYYADVADRVFSIEFVFVERHLAWLHAQCRGDWVLRLDGDEIPSPEMVSAIATAKDDRLVNSVAFARRSLFPTVECYIVQEPWYPDFQVRMVRNDGSLRFSGLVHTTAERTFPARTLEAPIYHLPFILSDIEARRARGERYESQRPALVAPTELAANDALLPEALPNVLTAPIPDEHRRRIEAVLSSSGPPVTRPPVNVRSVALQDTDGLWSGRVLPQSAYQASIEFIGAPVPLSPGERRPVYFRVCNTGSERWGWDPSIGPYLHVVHRLLDEARAPVDDWRPSFFTEWVAPGATTVVPGHVDAPSRPGRYVLEVKVRHAPERLFGDSQDVELVVRPGGAWST